MGALNVGYMLNNVFMQAPSYIDVRVITVASTAETHTVPAGADYVIFSGTADFYVRFDGSAAAVPAADITDGTGSELNPVGRMIKGLANISLVSATAGCVITMAFFKGIDKV